MTRTLSLLALSLSCMAWGQTKPAVQPPDPLEKFTQRVVTSEVCDGGCMIQPMVEESRIAALEREKAELLKTIAEQQAVIARLEKAQKRPAKVSYHIETCLAMMDTRCRYDTNPYIRRFSESCIMRGGSYAFNKRGQEICKFPVIDDLLPEKSHAVSTVTKGGR